MTPQTVASVSDGEADQSDVLRFLRLPQSYPDRAESVTEKVTHGARVFLAGKRAYKMKRAVRFPYLDYSTLEQRHAMCEREFAINSPVAPDIYLGVVPVTRQADGTLAIDGPGAPVEWAVRMRRFPDGALLSELYADRPPEPGLVRNLAEVVAHVHEQAPRLPGRLGAVRIGVILDEFRKAFAETPGGIPPSRIQSLHAALAAALGRVRACLDARARWGCVRRCHGDLHLGNIVLLNGRPLPFDAIEFDESFASTDTLYDLAFLLMDLEMRGYRQAANRLLNRYLQVSRREADILGLRAMPLFLAVRATIRAMVALERAAGGDAAAVAAGDAEADRYIGAAFAYFEPPRAALIAVGGPSGAGKSTLAAALAPDLGGRLGAIHLRSDVERKAMMGVGEFDRLSPMHYRPEVSEAVYHRLWRKAALALRAGFPVVVDATFLNAAERATVVATAARLHVPFRGLWLGVDEGIAKLRVNQRRLDASDATADVVSRQFAKVQAPVDWAHIAAGAPHAEAVEAAKAVLGRSGPIFPPPTLLV